HEDIVAGNGGHTGVAEIENGVDNDGFGGVRCCSCLKVSPTTEHGCAVVWTTQGTLVLRDKQWLASWRSWRTPDNWLTRMEVPPVLPSSPFLIFGALGF
ncbi:hypothetical protein U1Q18_037693, partial [Sarracenia purpurea var. burkii]